MEARARASGPEGGTMSRRQQRLVGRGCSGEGREEDSEAIKTWDPHSRQQQAACGGSSRSMRPLSEGGQLRGWLLQEGDEARLGRTLKLS